MFLFLLVGEMGKGVWGGGGGGGGGEGWGGGGCHLDA